MADYDVLLRLVADTRQFLDEIERAQSKLQGLGGVAGFLQKGFSGLATVGGAVLAGGMAAAGAAAAGLTAALTASAAAASEAQQVEARLEAALRATGGAAGVTAEGAKWLAEELSRLTRFDDEAILGAEALLLQFEGIGKEIFPAVTETALDLAEAFGQDLTMTARSLGRALIAPAEGLGMLKRFGADFTDAEAEMLEKMVAVGRAAEAQHYILEKLRSSVGGTARAVGETFAGRLAQLRTELGNLQEAIGSAVLPAVTQLLGKLLEFVRAEEVQATIQRIAKAIADFAMRAVEAIPKAIGWFDRLRDWLAQNQGVLFGIIFALGAAIAAFVYSVIIPALISLITAAAPVVAVILLLVGVGYLLYTAWTENWLGIRDAVMGFVRQARPWLEENIPKAIEVLKQAVEIAKRAIAGAIAALRAAWESDFLGIRTAVTNAVENILAVFRIFQAALQGDWREVGRQLRVIWDNIIGTLRAVWGGAWNLVRAAVQGLAQKIVDVFRNTDWRKLGQAVIDGIVSALVRGVALIAEWTEKIANAIMEILRGFLGISSPARATEWIGEMVVAGLERGLKSRMADLRELSLEVGAAAYGGLAAPPRAVEYNRRAFYNYGRMELRLEDADLLSRLLTELR